MPQKQDTTKPISQPPVRPQTKTSIKGKVKCVEPKPEAHQMMGEVVAEPEKKQIPKPKKQIPKK